MQEWWEALDFLGKFFAVIAIPSTVILVLQTIMMFIGLGGDSDASVDGVDADVDIADDVLDGSGIFGDDVPGGTDIDGIDSPGEPGLKILSFRTIIAFLAVFGWVGIELIKLGTGSVVAIAVSFAAGFGMMLIMAFLIRELFKLQSNGNLDIKNALGASGTAYIPIPALRTGKGKVTVTFQNATHELDAVTDEESDIPSYSEVLVIGVTGKDTLVVKKK